MIKKILPWIIAGIYLLSPFDIIPDWILGAGWLDDLAVLGFVIWMISRFKKSAGARQYNSGSWSEKFNRQYSKQTGYSKESENKKTSQKENKEETDPYKILGLERGASKEEIRAAYAELAAKYHPDKVQHLGKEFQELAHKKFTSINKAYQMLK